MNTDRPLVSAVINNYNYGRFLRDAIDSALAQTYANIEVIVVDDGSTDDSREIIASYGDRIIPVLKENGGQASAFNAGFAASRGEWICLLDSDDTWHPEKVEAIVAAVAEQEGVALIYHAYQCTDSDLRPVGKVLPKSFLEGEVAQRVLRSAGYWSCPPTSALALPRQVLAACAPIPVEVFRICADACLSYTVPFLGRVIAVRRSLCSYRIHGTNAYTRGGPTSLQRWSLDSAARAQRYRDTVDGANQVLERAGRVERLALRNHVAYALAIFHAGLGGHPSCLEVSWRLLWHASAASWRDRLRSVARFWVDLARTKWRSSQRNDA